MGGGGWISRLGRPGISDSERRMVGIEVEDRRIGAFFGGWGEDTTTGATGGGGGGGGGGTSFLTTGLAGLS